MNQFKGTNGSISFDGQAVRITRGGLAGFASGNRGEKVIPLSAVTGVEFRKAGLQLGFVQVNQSGHSTVAGSNRNRDLHVDENTVTFWPKRNEEARALVDALNAALIAR